MANLSNINDKFIVTDGGHVSIGATTTTYPLTVESGGVGTVLRAGTSFVSIDSVGSAASPSLIFNGDSNTGIWRPASDTLGFSTAGVERFKIGTSNALLIGTSYQLKFTTDDGSTQLGKLFDDVGFTVEGKINNNLNLRSLANTTQEGIKFQNKTGGVLSTHMFIEKAGNITIGNGDTGLTFGKLVLRGDPYVITDSGQARSFIDCSSNINPGANLYTGGISFGGASTGRAAISGVQGTSTDGDRQGLAFFTHSSGTGSADAAEAMRITTDGNVGIGTDSPNIGTNTGTAILTLKNTGTNRAVLNMTSTTPGTGVYAQEAFYNGGVLKTLVQHVGDGSTDSGYIKWFTTASGGSTTERMRIDSGGTVTIPGVIESGGGIKLGGTAAANLLDDYEEGTFSTTVLGITATTNTVKGVYTKIGNMCILQILVTLTGISAGTGNPYFSLPFTPSGASQIATSKNGAVPNINTIISGLAYMGIYGSNAQLYANTSSGGYINNTNWSDGLLSFTLSYRTV